VHDETKINKKKVEEDGEFFKDVLIKRKRR